MRDSPLETLNFDDHSQTYWHLLCIQGASLGIPVIFIIKQLTNQFGPGVAISSVVIGNLISWAIGFAIIAMAAPGKYNAIQNVNSLLGRVGSGFAILFLIFAFLTWYVVQLDYAVTAVNRLFLIKEGFSWIGLLIGIVISIFSIGGIRFIRVYSLYAFPLIILFMIFSLIYYGVANSFTFSWSGSFWGSFLVAAITLPAMVNLPTFFRHAKSVPDSFMGLNLMVLFTALFELYAIFLDAEEPGAMRIFGFITVLPTLGFIFISLVSVNLVNIYFASAGWEMIMPNRRSKWEYLFVGLLGSIAYFFFQDAEPVQRIGNMANNFLACLSLVMVLAFLTRLIVNHRPRSFEQLINVVCWLFGAGIGTVAGEWGKQESTQALMISISGSLIAFLLVIFVEEGVWAVRKLWGRVNG